MNPKPEMDKVQKKNNLWVSIFSLLKLKIHFLWLANKKKKKKGEWENL